MYKLLIADDEHWIRMGLKDAIDWKSCGVSEVWEAEDGGDALEKIQQVEPDVVIADIRMPDIDGLELCSILKEKYPKIKVIIISGYKDFEYARKAIVLGVYNYILKPLDEKCVMETVMKCIQDIENEKRESAEKEAIKTQLVESLPLMKQEFISGIFRNGTVDDEQTISRLMALGVSIGSPCYLIFIAELDNWSKIKGNLGVIAFNGLKNKLRDCVESWIERTGKGLCTWFDGDMLYCSVGIDFERYPMKAVESINDICRSFYNDTGYTATVCVSLPCYSLNHWPAAAKQAEACRKRKFFIGKGQVIHYEPWIQKNPAYKYNVENEKYILNCIKIGEKALLQDFLDSLKLELMSNQFSVSDDDARSIYHGMVEYVYRGVCEDLNQENYEFSDRILSLTRRLREVETLNEIHDIVQAEFLELANRLNELRGGGKRKIIQQVIDYTNRLYNEKITLSTAAEYVYLNSSYLSKLFYEEVGENFTRYLMKIRIKKAKELLADPRIRIYEAGEKVGYSDVKYFVKIFKDMEGITPADYRERCLQNTKIIE